MADPTLALKYDDLIKHIAFDRGWGFTAHDSLSADRLAICQEILKGGMRQFYNPPPLGQKEDIHEWSFLRPIATLTTSSSASGTTTTGSTGTAVKDTNNTPFTPEDVGATLTFTTSENAYRIVAYVSSSEVTVGSTLDDDDDFDEEGALAFTVGSYSIFALPDDFAAIDPVLTYPPTTGYPPVKVVGEGFIRTQQQHSTSTGRPRYAAVRAKSSDLSTGQRWDILLFPTPDQAYVLTYRYHAGQDALAATKYPLGGMQHSETILASCLAWAECNLEDKSGGAKYDQFMRRLVASVSADRKLTHRDYFGRMGDASSGSPTFRSPGAIVTYKGVDYS